MKRRSFLVSVGGAVSAGTFAGTISGNIGFNNNGTLAAGASPGTTVINTNLGLGSASIIEAELGGTNQGVDFDLIQVNGTVSLDGTLNVTHFGGFTPSAIDQFQIDGFGQPRVISIGG